jgi:hypothetical protein
MSHTTGNELIESLAELRRALPSMRLGQLVANMATVARGATPGAIWDAEDEELLAAIRWQLQQLDNGATMTAQQIAGPDHDGANGPPTSTSQPPPRQVS